MYCVLNISVSFMGGSTVYTYITGTPTPHACGCVIGRIWWFRGISFHSL